MIKEPIGTKRNKYHALNDMNRFNLHTYLLDEYNDRRMRKSRLK